MITIKIFLASSEELKPERLAIAELVTKLNYIWAQYDIFIRLVKWEYLDSSMAAKHKQEEYNDYLRECDMCVVLYWTKFGKYTEIELDTAYQLLNSDSNLKVMRVLFKEDSTDIADALRLFKEKYENAHPEMCKSFANETQLKEELTQQIIDCIQNKLECDHCCHAKNMRKLQKLLSITDEDEPEFNEYTLEIQSVRESISKNEWTMNELKHYTKNN